MLAFTISYCLLLELSIVQSIHSHRLSFITNGQDISVEEPSISPRVLTTDGWKWSSQCSQRVNDALRAAAKDDGNLVGGKGRSRGRRNTGRGGGGKKGRHDKEERGKGRGAAGDGRRGRGKGAGGEASVRAAAERTPGGWNVLEDVWERISREKESEKRERELEGKRIPNIFFGTRGEEEASARRRVPPSGGDRRSGRRSAKGGRGRGRTRTGDRGRRGEGEVGRKAAEAKGPRKSGGMGRERARDTLDSRVLEEEGVLGGGRRRRRPREVPPRPSGPILLRPLRAAPGVDAAISGMAINRIEVAAPMGCSFEGENGDSPPSAKVTVVFERVVVSGHVEIRGRLHSARRARDDPERGNRLYLECEMTAGVRDVAVTVSIRAEGGRGEGEKEGGGGGGWGPEPRGVEDVERSENMGRAGTSGGGERGSKGEREGRGERTLVGRTYPDAASQGRQGAEASSAGRWHRSKERICIGEPTPVQADSRLEMGDGRAEVRGVEDGTTEWKRVSRGADVGVEGSGNGEQNEDDADRARRRRRALAKWSSVRWLTEERGRGRDEGRKAPLAVQRALSSRNERGATRSVYGVKCANMAPEAQGRKGLPFRRWEAKRRRRREAGGGVKVSNRGLPRNKRELFVPNAKVNSSEVPSGPLKGVNETDFILAAEDFSWIDWVRFGRDDSNATAENRSRSAAVDDVETEGGMRRGRRRRKAWRFAVSGAPVPRLTMKWGSTVTGRPLVLFRGCDGEFERMRNAWESELQFDRNVKAKIPELGMLRKETEELFFSGVKHMAVLFSERTVRRVLAANLAAKMGYILSYG